MLIELGRLVRIEWRGPRRALRFAEWPMRRAPLLCFETTLTRASLLIVYAPRKVGSATAAGVAQYARMHWGKLGRMQQVEGATLEGQLEVLGPCVRVLYATRKGDSRLVDYDHEFGTVEGGRKLPRFTPPNVCTSRSPGVPRGTFQLAGGTYRVTTHGIVG